MHLNYQPLRKLTGKIHLWLGMASGMVIVILGITGCIYTFVDELKPIVYHDSMFIETVTPGKMLPMQELRDKAAKALHKKVPLMDIEVFTDPQRTMVFRYRNRNDNANLYTNYFINYDRVFMNPYTGEVVKVENTKWEFFNIIVMLHCTLLLGYWGKQVITWSTIIFIVMLLSGLILWWPKNDAAARKRFSFKWRPGTTWKRKNYDLHQILGFYIITISFFVALSGLSMILPKLDYAIQYIVDGGASGNSKSMVHISHMGGNKNDVPEKDGILNQIAKHAAMMNPGAAEYRIFTPKASTDPLIIKSFKDKNTHYAYLQDSYDQSTARHTSTTLFSDLSSGEKVHEVTYDIHVGAILGIPGKILVFLASLITASLPISGFFIWKGRKNKI